MVKHAYEAQASFHSSYYPPDCHPSACGAPTAMHLQVIADVDSWVEMGAIISAAATLAQQAHDEAVEVASAKRRAEEAAVVKSDAPPGAATTPAVVAAVAAGEAAAAAVPTEAHLSHAVGAGGVAAQEKKHPAPLTEEEVLELSTPNGVDVQAPALDHKLAVLAAAEKAAEMGPPPAEVEIQFMSQQLKGEHVVATNDGAEAPGMQPCARVAVEVQEVAAREIDLQEVVAVEMEVQEVVRVKLEVQDRVGLPLDMQRECVTVGMAVQQSTSVPMNAQQQVAIESPLVPEPGEVHQGRKGVEGMLAAAQGRAQQLEGQLAAANARIAELELQLHHLLLKQQQHLTSDMGMQHVASEKADAPIRPALVELLCSFGPETARGHTTTLDVPVRPPHNSDSHLPLMPLPELQAVRT
jgi:hypothetical protein